ncbi:protein phosphatase 2C domain-containing protein [Streptomyces sp. RS10V-4]|uniref:protein phosphatase 2C domain-containing protein n=1 Tax=Streptomyces rhizoryzae TaxID=2932493 RepID=UPI002003101A|nr:protein phosphatase 2C domain-containing protein [Streptomyces rhizoryzae]MCK7625499.1 protein phosphatase 2C domain-containing protein [Streptomyces rhizoryzae]
MSTGFEPRPWEPSGWEPRPWEPPRRALPGEPPDGDAPAAPPWRCTLPEADPEALGDLVPGTALESARFGPLAVRAVSRCGTGAGERGEGRRDALLTARFGTGPDALLLVATATGAPAAGAAAGRVARDACAWIGGAVGRGATRLAHDLRTGHHDALRAGLRRLSDRGYGTLRGRAAERDDAPGGPPAALRCLLLPGDPDCRARVFFGVGAGGLLRLRDGAWEDLEPPGGREGADPDGGPGPDPDGGPRPAPFRFRTVTGRPGDVLLLCGTALAGPLTGGAPGLAARLAAAWSAGPPAPADFLTAAQPPDPAATGDHTAAAVWEPLPAGPAGRGRSDRPEAE